MKQLGKCQATRKAFSELNSSFSEVFGQDFTDAVAKDRKVTTTDETNREFT